MKFNSLYFVILAQFFIISLFSIDQTNGYCCKVNGFYGFPPNCNMFGCNCECSKCDEATDRACCHVENFGIAQEVCSKKKKRSLQQKDLETLRADYNKILTRREK